MNAKDTRGVIFFLSCFNPIKVSIKLISDKVPDYSENRHM